MAGLIAELITVVRNYVANRNGGPGQAIYIEGTGLGKAGLNAVVYGQAGVFSRPPKGTRGITVRLGRERVLIAAHNYQVEINWLNDGGTTVFSTTADGKTVKARLDLNPDGTINLNGTGHYLTMWGAMDAALSTLTGLLASHVHASLGSPSPTLAGLTCDISAAKATSLRTDG